VRRPYMPDRAPLVRRDLEYCYCSVSRLVTTLMRLQAVGRHSFCSATMVCCHRQRLSPPPCAAPAGFRCYKVIAVSAGLDYAAMAPRLQYYYNYRQSVSN